MAVFVTLPEWQGFYNSLRLVIITTSANCKKNRLSFKNRVGLGVSDPGNGCSLGQAEARHPTIKSIKPACGA